MAIFAGLLLVGIVLWMIARGAQQSSPVTKNRVFFQQVHGITHKNDDGSSRQKVIGDCHEGEELVLVPEPTNPYDPYAVKICRKNGEQIGYWPADGRLAGDLESGWKYWVTIDEIYPFEENQKKHGVRLRVEVLTMSRVTEARKKRQAVATASKVKV
jgi:hypothetical protein